MMKIPDHIAIILDGNRRFAKARGEKPWKGHAEGAKNVERLIKWCIELGVKELTMFAFSTENFKRTAEEVNELMKLFAVWFRKILNNNDVKKHKVRINFIGRLEMLPKDVREAAEKLMKSTERHTGLKVNFCLAYGSRMEIADAAKKLASDCVSGKIKPSDITEELLGKHLYLASCPGMIIRPGGEQRISNFLLWQAAYSELYFTKTLWPEFDKTCLLRAIRAFNRRERRFGK